MAENHELMSLFPEEPEDVTPVESLLRFPRGNSGMCASVRKLWVQRMKGIKQVELELGQFNVLVGANNSGKSTILQAIDLAFRLANYHAEFKQGELVLPAQGRRLPDEMMPVADVVDFWYARQTREQNKRLPVVLGLLVDLGDEGELELEFEIRRMWGGTNSKLVRLSEGISEDAFGAILARRPILIPASSGMVTREEWRTPARLEVLSLTGRHNETLRNLLLKLSENQAALESLQEVLDRHFGAQIRVADFNFTTDQFITAQYQQIGLVHDLFSAGGGSQQIVQILVYLLLYSPGIALLDEPDAHLNSSM